MFKSFHFLLFLFMFIPTSGATSTDYELAQRLIGQWSLTYTIPQFEEEPELHLESYTLSELKEVSLHPETYQIWGTSPVGEPMIAQLEPHKHHSCVSPWRFMRSVVEHDHIIYTTLPKEGPGVVENISILQLLNDLPNPLLTQEGEKRA